MLICTLAPLLKAAQRLLTSRSCCFALQAIVPRSSKQDRIAANRQLDFVLTDDQMRRMDALDGSMHPQSAE